MATLYVENVPDELYDALRQRAAKRRSSIAREVIEVLAGAVPTEAELQRREDLYQTILRLQAQKPPSPGPFPSTEETLREDRQR